MRNARISFETPELLWKVLTARRWELLKSLCGAGPVSIREAARRVGRDVKTVSDQNSLRRSSAGRGTPLVQPLRDATPPCRGNLTGSIISVYERSGQASQRDAPKSTGLADR
jgi:hypothetical protein